jgi:hypothetical protein
MNVEPALSKQLQLGLSYLDGRAPNCFPGQFELVFDGHGTHMLFLTPYKKWSWLASSKLLGGILYLDGSGAYMLPVHFALGFCSLIEVEPAYSQHTSGKD